MEKIEITRQINTIKNKINSLSLCKIVIDNVESVNNHEFIIDITGGFGGSKRWCVYLHQIEEIIDSFLDAWILELNVDNANDIWKLKLVVCI